MTITPDVRITVGSAPAVVQYTALVGPGVFRVDAIVPDLPDGDCPATVIVEGMESPPDGAYLCVRR